MRNVIALATAVVVVAGIAKADQFTDQIVSNLQGLGYEFIEIDNGISQVKAEAIRGTDKLEIIYDRATGEIIKQESERAEARDVGREGVRVRDRDRDFVRGSDDDDDDDRGRGRGRGRGGDDHDDDDDDDDDDHGGRGRGGDDHGGRGGDDDRDDDDDRGGDDDGGRDSDDD